MKAKGYPVEDFEQGVADISVDFPGLVVDYRGLHLIATRGDQEEVSTEEMRKAMVHARALFESLVKDERSVEALDEKEEESNVSRKRKTNDREQVDTGEERLRDEQIAEGQVVDEGMEKNRPAADLQAATKT